MISNKLKKKRLFLLDMDGTIYLDDTLFKYSLDFLNYIKSIGGKYVFLTNNSSRSINDYINKLNKMDIDVNLSNFMTSSQATSIHLRENYMDKKIYVLGTKSFKRELKEDGLNIVEEYLATNPDLVCPTSFGFIPDCGSICNMLETATGKTPVYIGKPKSTMVNLAIDATGFTKEETIVIGDRLYTDIACGINAGVSTSVVLTGETKSEHLDDTDYKPEYVFKNIGELYKTLIK